MCTSSILRVNPQTFLFWHRLVGHNGLSPREWFNSIGFDYYDQTPKSSRELAPYLDAHQLLYKGLPFPVFAEQKCGHCSECVAEKVTDLQKRSLLESSQSAWLFFATFTYDDEHVPYHTDLSVSDAPARQTLRPKDIQAMRHRVDKRLSQLDPSDALYKLDYSMVYVGEYGGKFNRPHYHCLYYVRPHLCSKDMLRLREIFMQDWVCPLRVEVRNGKKLSYEYLPIPPKKYTLDKKYEWYNRKFNTLVSDYRATCPMARLTLVANPFYKGLIEDWQIARDSRKTAQYVMKYIGKQFCHKSAEYDTPRTIRERGYQKYPLAPFLQTPRKRALGNVVLDNPDVVASIKNSTDGTFYYTSLDGKTSRTKITNAIKNELYKPFYRLFPQHAKISAYAKCALSYIIQDSAKWQHCHELNPKSTDDLIKRFYNDKKTDITYNEVLYAAPDLYDWICSQPYLNTHRNTLTYRNEQTPKLAVHVLQRVKKNRQKYVRGNRNTIYNVLSVFGRTDLDTFSYFLRQHRDYAYRFVAQYFGYFHELPNDAGYRQYIYDRYDYFAPKEESKYTHVQRANDRYNKHTYQINTCNKMSDNE